MDKKVIELIKNNEIIELKKIIESNFEEIKYNKNLYHCAVDNNNYDALKCLCGNSTNILLYLYKNNCLDIKTIKFIINYNYEDITGKIIYQLTKDNREDLLLLIFNNCIFDNDFIIKLILYNKNKISLSKSKLKELISKEKNKFISAINFTSNEEVWDIPLIIACRNKNENIVKILIEYGANVNIENEDGDTPLTISIKKENENIVKYLIDHGSNVNTEYGNTPLLIACWKKNETIVKYLIDHGADVNRKDIYDNTPLIIALENENENIIKYLIEHGAKVNVENEDGDTPLVIAFKNKNENMIKYLIDHGADINMKDKYGKTLLYETCWHENENILNYLLENEANYKQNK